MINVKKKGNLFENRWAHFLSDNGFKAWKDAGSGCGNREKADVGNNENIHWEVKAVAGINLQAVWKKAELECQKTHNTPMLAIHFNGMKEDEFLVVMNNFDYIDLWRKSKEPKSTAKIESRDEKYKIERLVTAAKEVLRLYGRE